MKILLIDNYDSFTYNLLHLILSAYETATVDIVKNDKIDVEKAKEYERIVISPGAGIPSEKNNVPKIIRELSPDKSILGICLGHQSIAISFGAKIFCSDSPLHGIKTPIHLLHQEGIFKNLSSTIMAGRYHSWFVCKKSLPHCLDITAVDENGEIMALSHKYYDVHGVQFHPESIMTECGKVIMQNFLKGKK